MGKWKGGYVYHLWHDDGVGGGGDATRPAAAATRFRHVRDYPTYAEGIAAGLRPKGLNATELLKTRMAEGQNSINEMAWLRSLRHMNDPRTGAAIAADPVYRMRADGTEDVTAPPGYHLMRIGPTEFALHDGYANIITDLTAPSWWRSSEVRSGVVKALGFSKSVTLLFDTFHLGRLALWKFAITGKMTYGKGVTLLDNTAADIHEMAQRGEIPQAWVQDLVENRRRLELALHEGFNIGKVADNMSSDWLHHLPVIGDFNQWLFGQYQRGAMAEDYLVEFERLKKVRPDVDEKLISRQVASDLNGRFGNLGRQGLLRSKTAQDLARILLLAPQWNEALIRAEVGSLWQLAKVPHELATKQRLVAGTLLRATGLMIVAQFAANQILNLATRGKPTWENEEEGFEAKISAWIPDLIGNSPGFFYNPLALPAEYTHLITKQLTRSQDGADAMWRIANSRLSGPSRAALMLATRKDALGHALRPGEVFPAMAVALTPVPIAAGTLGAAAKELVTGQESEKYPGQFQKQALASFGLKTDQAPSPEQRVRALASAFNREHGVVPSGEFYTGDFYDLTRALRIGNLSDAHDFMQDVLAKKTLEQIQKHFTTWVNAPYTSQRARERQFFGGLDACQRAAYLKSREDRKAVAREAMRVLRETVAVGR